MVFYSKFCVEFENPFLSSSAGVGFKASQRDNYRTSYYFVNVPNNFLNYQPIEMSSVWFVT